MQRIISQFLSLYQTFTDSISDVLHIFFSIFCAFQHTQKAHIILPITRFDSLSFEKMCAPHSFLCYTIVMTRDPAGLPLGKRYIPHPIARYKGSDSPMGKRPTIQMVAERAGVSRGTVDRVLNNRSYVKAEVRTRILAAMQELGYVSPRDAHQKALNESRFSAHRAGCRPAQLAEQPLPGRGAARRTGRTH